MLTRDELRETEDFFFDARRCTSDNEWNIDTPPRSDGSAYDLSAVLSRRSSQSEGGRAKTDARDCGRIMVIGFHVIRV